MFLKTPTTHIHSHLPKIPSWILFPSTINFLSKWAFLKCWGNQQIPRFQTGILSLIWISDHLVVIMFMEMETQLICHFPKEQHFCLLLSHQHLLRDSKLLVCHRLLTVKSMVVARISAPVKIITRGTKFVNFTLRLLLS